MSPGDTFFFQRDGVNGRRYSARWREVAGVVTEPNTDETNSETENLFREESQQREKAQLHSYPLNSTSLLSINTLHIFHCQFRNIKIFKVCKMWPHFHCPLVASRICELSSPRQASHFPFLFSLLCSSNAPLFFFFCFNSHPQV